MTKIIKRIIVLPIYIKNAGLDIPKIKAIKIRKRMRKRTKKEEEEDGRHRADVVICRMGLGRSRPGQPPTASQPGPLDLVTSG